MRLKFYASVLLFSAAFLLVGVRAVFSQTETPTPAPSQNQDTSQLQEQIKQYEQKISELRGQQQTLSSQIGIMDNQIKLTEARIAATQEKIKSLGKDIDIAKNKVSDLEDNIGKSTKALLGRIAGVYQIGSINPWEMLLTSDSISNFMTRLTYLKVVQAYDKRNIYTAEQAKNDYNNQKQIYEDKQKEQEALSKKLEDYTVQLEGEKKSKQTLLDETRGSESNYQRLLAQARAQLSGFRTFASSQGGASLLSGQTSCDDWGCYYNQRDTQWGKLLINNATNCGFGSVDEPCTMASYGCLITSVAMVASHMGRQILPSDIAQSSGNNFSVGTAMLKYTINVKGMTLSRSGTSIDSSLASGPVIVGVRAYGGTHFVVLKSGSNGDYIMYDPFIPNGKNTKFTDHYSVSSIFEINKLSIN